MKKLQKHFAVCGALILTLLAAGMPQCSFAQQGIGTLQGKVVDEASVPVIGASVVVNGSAKGTSTNADGSFTLSGLTDGDVLEISFLGYDTQEVVYHGQTFIDVTLHEQTLQGEAVVVTALGIKRSEKALSYNVQKVGGEELTTVKDANFMNSLVGKVAGVQISSSAAGAGGAARVVMRGTKSLTKDDNALYVIDGVPMFNINSGNAAGGTIARQPGSSSAADINPEDIESISMLTGPSAAALYGSDAANGVVLITTKKGSVGATHVTYSNSTSFSKPFVMPKFQNIYGNVSGVKESWGSRLETPSSYSPEDFFNTGVQEINGVTLTTGSEKNQLYASVSTTNTTGILPNSDYNRYNFSIRNTTKFAKDKLTFDFGAQYIIQDNKNMVGSGQYFSPLPSLYLMPRGESFEEVQMFERYSDTRHIMEQFWPKEIFPVDDDMQNPYWMMHRMLHETDKYRYMFNAGLTWKINDWMNLSGRVKVDNSNQDSYRKYYASTSLTFALSKRGFYEHAKQTDRSTYADVLLSINKSLFNDRFSINANVGASINNVTENSMYINGGLSMIPNFFHLGNIDMSSQHQNELKWHDQTQSIFGSLELGWDHWLYLTVTGRNDWASQLAFTSKQSYFYPSVGLSVVFNELFDLPEAISLLKLRGSWAEVASAPSRYLTRMQYLYDEAEKKYEYPDNHYNTDLRPENTRSWELGLDARFFRNHLHLNATYYRSNTYNQTFTVPASASSGYKNNIVQTGNIQNQGIELSFGYENTWDKFGFSTNFTYTLNRNKIIRLANGATNPETGEAIVMDVFPMGVLGIGGGPTMRLAEGGTMGDLYTNMYLRETPNGYVWRDAATEDIAIDSDPNHYKYIGTTLPKYHMGWQGSLSYAGVDISWTVAARVGGLVISDTQAMLDRYGVSEASAKARENGGVILPDGSRIDAEKYYRKISTASGSYYVYDATNVRLADLSLSYTLPRRWFRNKLGMTVSLTGHNLWMIYCKAPFDPESTSSVSNNFYQAVDYYQMPSLRSYGFSVKLSF